MYKQIYHTAPVTIISEVFNRDIHTYCTRGSQSVRVLYRRTQKVANSFVKTSSHNWHSLPSENTSVKHISIFNRQHKRYILHNVMA